LDRTAKSLYPRVRKLEKGAAKEVGRRFSDKIKKHYFPSKEKNTKTDYSVGKRAVTLKF
jgi:hypothetical protein